MFLFRRFIHEKAMPPIYHPRKPLQVKFPAWEILLCGAGKIIWFGSGLFPARHTGVIIEMSHEDWQVLLNQLHCSVCGPGRAASCSLERGRGCESMKIRLCTHVSLVKIPFVATCVFANSKVIVRVLEHEFYMYGMRTKIIWSQKWTSIGFEGGRLICLCKSMVLRFISSF